VSVLIPTYNHAEFISQAVESVLDQETEFDFEVIVRDDASTDGTWEIVKSLRGTRRVHLRTYRAESNEFSTVRPILPLMRAARGKMIALCDGDDYWIRRDKLAVQVDYLLGDACLSAVGHGILIDQGGVLGDGGVVAAKKRFPAGSVDPVFSLPTVSLMFRKDGAPPPEAYETAPFGDVILKAWLSGRGAVLVDGAFVGAVHRVHGRGMHNGLTPEGRALKSMSSLTAASMLLGRAGDTRLASELFAEAVDVGLSHLESQCGLRVGGSVRKRIRWLGRTRSAAREKLDPQLVAFARRAAHRGACWFGSNRS